eukprot:TRINITY_DN473_c3_g1_i1.p1 TRINITY_DN473_c3_g1~~TRINITY_DN473_c3_g1_i1.p1  ORF type:complete len:215 (-),score=44.89 TRINITY_DN473_c3_g1_i1:122-766(-)
MSNNNNNEDENERDEFNCLICYELCKESVYTTCGHIYCKHCIVKYWMTSVPNKDKPVACPVDRTKVSLLIPARSVKTYVEKREKERNKEVDEKEIEGEDIDEDEYTTEELDNIIKNYNEIFGDHSRQNTIEQLQEDFSIIKHLFRSNFYVKLVIAIAIILIVLYLISPIDIIPDFIPVMGYLDDLLVIVFFVLFALLSGDLHRHYTYRQYRREL